MFTFENDENTERTEGQQPENAAPAGDGADAAAQPDENGCTYHTGRIPEDPDQPRAAQPDDSRGGAPGPQTGPNGAPYGQNRYPYGQNRYPYGNQGYPYGRQQPVGAYPPGGAGSGGRRSVGSIVLVAVAAVLAGLAISGILFSRFSANLNSRRTESSERPASTTTSGQGSEDGPSIVLADAPAEPGVTAAAAPSAEGYSAARVYEIINESSVGILIYSNDSAELVSEGSGVIIGENEPGTRTYIITCAHVINSMGTSAKVMTSDGSTYDAQIVGYDKRTDLGVVMIKKTGLKSAEFAKADSVRVGDTVYAIGNPGGSEFAGSFTNGMVSAISRPVSSSTSYTTKCIQHTAAINPGNSGGALVNAFGQVIGINSKKIVSTDYEGMGFAVPSDVVQEIANDLILNGYIPNRAKLGITYLPASSYENYMMVVQLKEYPKGSIVIEGISSDSNLKKEDVEKGDLIIAVNGKPLTDSDVLPNIMEKAKPGDKLTLSIVRVSSNYTVKEFDVTVELIEDRGTVLEDEETEPETDEHDGDFYVKP